MSYSTLSPSKSFELPSSFVWWSLRLENIGLVTIMASSCYASTLHSKSKCFFRKVLENIIIAKLRNALLKELLQQVWCRWKERTPSLISWGTLGLGVLEICPFVLVTCKTLTHFTMIPSIHPKSFWNLSTVAKNHLHWHFELLLQGGCARLVWATLAPSTMLLSSSLLISSWCKWEEWGVHPLF